jgi:hypothetical protein
MNTMALDTLILATFLSQLRNKSYFDILFARQLKYSFKIVCKILH